MLAELTILVSILFTRCIILYRVYNIKSVLKVTSLERVSKVLTYTKIYCIMKVSKETVVRFDTNMILRRWDT